MPTQTILEMTREATTGRLQKKRGNEFLLQVAEMWNVRHWSSAQIGNELGVTRNVIIGVVSRENEKVDKGKVGIKFERRPPGFSGLNQSKRVSKPKSRSATGLVQKIRKAKDAAAQLRQSLLLDAYGDVDLTACVRTPFSQRCFLVDLSSDRCRWPVGEDGNQFYCGGGTLGVPPYCPAHAHMAFKPMSKRKGPMFAFRR